MADADAPLIRKLIVASLEGGDAHTDDAGRRVPRPAVVEGVYGVRRVGVDVLQEVVAAIAVDQGLP